MKREKEMAQQINVLVVEDESAVQSILAAFLNRYTSEKGLVAEMKATADAVKGLFELTTSGARYDAVLLDVRLPTMSGDEIYNSLAQVNPDMLDRVLFVTAYPDDLYERWPAKKLNVLEKPFRYDKFADSLEGILKAA
jgi:DNA-binding NtrC family response regulator